ncbi:ATP-grasp domain-containing protein [Clostridium saccharoperbutylacetonicum]|uniref:ATP-grasp domain-containing protein n=1 Tax=Clostridium saccharoperbutylacetonicum TaxID=36745 RepID=UPI0039E89B4F
MKKNLLMIGVSRSVGGKLTKEDEIDVYAIEEEEIYIRNKIKDYKSSVIKKVIKCKYIDSDEYIDKVKELSKEIKFHGVLAARDYAVRAASKVAEMLELPGIGVENANILTNKCKLRNACEKYNIPHPKFKKINTIGELREFYQGKAIIFKPATLQASLGISKINCLNDIDWAWNNTTLTKDEKAVNRELSRENIAEDFIGGFEISVESLVKDGEIIFNNITRKLTFEDSCVEKAHIIPSCLPKQLEKRILQEKEHFVKSMRIKSGILHSEWKIENDNPILIECAGRIPGDKIYELMSISYDFAFLKELSNLLVDNEVHINTMPKKVSQIRYFESKPGTLKEIKGLEILDNPEVIEWNINVKKGDRIPKVTSSFDRIGFFIISAVNINELEKLEKKILSGVEFIVD